MDKLVDHRHEEIVESKELYIEMDAEIADIYNKSKAVSTSQGSSFNLMKQSSKRRRSKKQIEEEKKQEELRRLDVEQKLQQFDAMQQKVENMQGAAEHLSQAQGFLDHLKESNLVYYNDAGNLCTVDNVEEMQELKRQRLEES